MQICATLFSCLKNVNSLTVSLTQSCCVCWCVLHSLRCTPPPHSTPSQLVFFPGKPPSARLHASSSLGLSLMDRRAEGLKVNCRWRQHTHRPPPALRSPVSRPQTTPSEDHLCFQRLTLREVFFLCLHIKEETFHPAERGRVQTIRFVSVTSDVCHWSWFQGDEINQIRHQIVSSVAPFV